MPNFDTTALSIGEVAARTGISASTLRAWEARYGFPAPPGASGTHRRYSEVDCRALMQVKHARDRGHDLTAAIESGFDALRRAASSLFFGLRMRHPELPLVVLPQSYMSAVSHALEDEALAHPGGVLIAAFQCRRAWQVAARRWERLAQSAHAAIQFADFAAAEHEGASWRIPVTERTSLVEEWSVICDTPRWWGCLVGREVAPDPLQPSRRRFQAMWSLEPEVVRTASRVGATLATSSTPELAPVLAERLQHRLELRPSTRHETSELTGRIFERLDRAVRGADRRTA